MSKLDFYFKEIFFGKEDLSEVMFEVLGFWVIVCDILTECIALRAGEALRKAFTGLLTPGRRERDEEVRGDAKQLCKYGDAGRDILKNKYVIFYIWL